MSEYNGYPSWAQWNVSLWLNNDEGMYRTMLHELKAAGGCRRIAAERLLDVLPRTTPDGARYTRTAIIGAMREAGE